MNFISEESFSFFLKATNSPAMKLRMYALNYNHEKHPHELHFHAIFCKMLVKKRMNFISRKFFIFL